MMADEPISSELRLFEGGVFSACAPALLTTQSLLGELTEEEAELFHLYMICWRPRIRVLPDACEADRDTFYFAFSIDGPAGPTEWHAELTNIWGDPDLQVRGRPPYTEFELFSGKDRLFEQNVAWWLSQMKFVAGNCDDQPDLFDLEVLYVGQAYGDMGSRTARDRLISHSTLQAILSEANLEAPHNEVDIVLLGMENPIQAVSMMPTVEAADEDSAVEEFFRLITAAPSLGQRINFTEAALIRYFQPRFNDKFKDVFPSRSHTSYQECFELDLNSVGFTLDGRPLFGRLWSTSVQPDWLHLKTYFLHSPEERRDMFSFAQPAGAEEA